jgi:hypothetical protein
VPERTRQHADLPTVMRIVLHQIGQHVDGPARHPSHAGLPSSERGFEQPREFIRRSAQRPARVA